jgi:micrococcal nuclease
MSKKIIKPLFIFLGLFLLHIFFLENKNFNNLPILEKEVVAVERKEYLVKKVIDGDTIIIIDNNKEEFVRLIGVDTPEIDYENNKSECFAEEAKEQAKKLLENKKVFLEADNSQANRDKYDRLLRYVFLENNINFNQWLIEQGLAKEYTFKNSKYKYQTEFKTAEKLARENKVGLWGKCE